MIRRHASFYGIPPPRVWNSHTQADLVAHFSRELPAGTNGSAVLHVRVAIVKGVYTTPPSDFSNILLRDGSGTPREIAVFLHPTYRWMTGERLTDALMTCVVTSGVAKGPFSDPEPGDVCKEEDKVHARFEATPITLEKGAELLALKVPIGAEDIEYTSTLVSVCQESQASVPTVLQFVCQRGLKMEKRDLCHIAAMWMDQTEGLQFTVVHHGPAAIATSTPPPSSFASSSPSSKTIPAGLNKQR